MKKVKLLSIILALVLFITNTMNLFASNPSRTIDLFTGWTFEENDITVLGTPAGEDNDGYYAWPNSTEVVPGGANGSGYALKVYGANLGNGKTETGLKSNTEYELTFWAKTENATGNVFANVGIENYAADQAPVYLNAFTNEWAKYTITFKTGAESTSAKFYTWLFTDNGGSIELFLDNVVLAEKKGQSLLAPGWTFEENDITVLGTPAGEDNDDYYAWPNCTEVVEGGANGSGYALKVYGANLGNGKTETGLKSNTEYELTFWAKTENATGNVFANVGIENYAADQAPVYLNAFTNEWAKYTITFKTGAESTSAKFYTWLFTDNGGSIELFLDNVVLAEKVAQPKEGQSLLAPGWTFEENDITVLGTPAGEDNDGYYAWPNCTEVVPSGANGSGYALKVYGGNVGNGKTETGLKPNTDYELTFWAKTENATGNVFANVGISNYAANQADIYLNAFTNEWAKYTITFKTGAESTMARMFTSLWTDNGGSIELFLDDVVLAEKVVQPKEGQSLLAPGWTFEENDITVLGTPAGEDNDGYYAWPNCTEVVEGGANGSGYALKVYGGNVGNGKTETGLKPNTDYELIFWAKTENATGNVFANVGISNYAADQADMYLNAFTNEWAKYTITFKTGAENTSARFFTSLWTDNGGSIELFLDDVVLAENHDNVIRWNDSGSKTNLDWQKDQTLKVLCIGNSFSVDAQEYFYDIAKDMGVENIKIGNLYIGGCTLAMHLDNAKNNRKVYTYYTNETGTWNETANYSLIDAVKSENWDYISFQQQSTTCGTEGALKELQPLIDIVAPLCPNARTAWFMTWAHQSDSTQVGFIENYNGNQDAMYKAIASQVKTEIETNSSIDLIIPTGTTIQNARTSYLGDTLTRDGYHLSYGIGRYIAALSFVRALTGISVNELTYAPQGISQKVQNIAIESVLNAIKNPYEVTESKIEMNEAQSLFAPGWTFEENDFTILGTPDGEDSDGYYEWPNSTEVVPGGANGSGSALKVYGGNVGNGKTETGLKANTEYELTFWAKTENAIGNVFANVGIQNYATNQDPVYLNTFTNEWAKYTITFKTGADSISAQFYTYLFTDNGGSIDLFLDNVVLTEKTEQPKEAQSLFAPGWTFEENDITLLGTPDGEDGDGYYAWPNCTEVVSGGANGSGYALKIYGGNVGNGRIETGLKPNTEYKLTFWARTENAVGNVFANVGISEFATGQADIYLNAFTNEWAKYTITFKTGAESTSARFFTSLWTDNDGTIDLYIDEVELQELTDVSAPKTGNSTRPMFMLVLTLVSGFVAIVCLKSRQEGWYVKKNH